MSRQIHTVFQRSIYGRFIEPFRFMRALLAIVAPAMVLFAIEAKAGEMTRNATAVGCIQPSSGRSVAQLLASRSDLFLEDQTALVGPQRASKPLIVLIDTRKGKNKSKPLPEPDFIIQGPGGFVACWGNVCDFFPDPKPSPPPSTIRI